jgi:hypothetical protein
MKKIIFFYGIVCYLFTISCNNSSNSTINNNDSIVDSSKFSKSEIIFQVPSPDEFISLLKSTKATYKASVTSPENQSYIELYKQKLNLGVYAADMSYLATFNKFQETIRYFSKVKNMSDQLGITSSIDKKTFDRLQSNITNVDSISSITNNSFYNVVDKLQHNDDGYTLALITTGGWVESMYIACQLVDNYDEKNLIIQRIASQKVVLNNIIEMLKTMQSQPQISNFLDKFTNLKSVMDKITAKADNTNSTKQDSTKIVIGTKTFYLFDKNTFNQFKQDIEKFRNEIIKPA